MKDDSKRFVIVSGLSGAGKTVVLRALEDQGFYCIDNLPIGFLSNFARLAADSPLPSYDRVAVGVDARNPVAELSGFPGVLAAIEADGLFPELLFVEADDDVIIKRFSETRRPHPLSSGQRSLSEAIHHERDIMEPIAEHADLRIDTTRMHIHDLRDFVGQAVAQRPAGSLALQFVSFGFKNGVPRDADFVFDARCLPNPYWKEDLRPLTGRDEPVRRYLGDADSVNEFIADIRVLLERWVPRFDADDRAYLTVAVGCTGGRHRSVYVTEALAAHFRPAWATTTITHRDLG